MAISEETFGSRGRFVGALGLLLPKGNAYHFPINRRSCRCPLALNPLL